MSTPHWLQDYADGQVFFRGHPPGDSAASEQWLLDCVEWGVDELGWKMTADEKHRVCEAHERIFMIPRCKDGCAQCAPEETESQRAHDKGTAPQGIDMRCKRNVWVAVEQGTVTMLEDGTEFTAFPFTMIDPGAALLVVSPTN